MANGITRYYLQHEVVQLIFGQPLRHVLTQGNQGDVAHVDRI